MKNKNISQMALERIRKEGIKPLARSVFNFKRFLFWTLVMTSIVIGSITMTIILTALWHNEWYLFNVYGFNFVLKTLPYFWLISLIVFMIVGEYYYRQTLLGYRRSLSLIIGVYLAATILVGSIFYLIGVGNYIEESLENNLSNYRAIILNRNVFWSHPEDGLLSGEIIRIRQDELEIMDFDGISWIIETKNSLIQPETKIIIGERIKIRGQIKVGRVFEATEIRSWLNLNN